MKPYDVRDATIDICLNCKRVDCPGECDAVLEYKGERVWVVEKSFTATNGNEHKSWVLSAGKTLSTTTVLHRAQRYYTEKSARNALWRARQLSAKKSNLKIVELEGEKINEIC